MNSPINLLALQHIEREHPGPLSDYLHRDGIYWHAENSDKGEPIPDIENFDTIWPMGSLAIRNWVLNLPPTFGSVSDITCLQMHSVAGDHFESAGNRCLYIERPPQRKLATNKNMLFRFKHRLRFR